MLKKLFNRLGGDPNQKIINEYAEWVAEINAREEYFETLSDQELAAQTEKFKRDIQEGLNAGKKLQDVLDEIMVDAFAVVREASKRTIGLRHYDVQLIGGMILHDGQVVEMRTGEGKTLVATLPLYLNALTGKGVHLITVNDYLARRDARWMAPIFDMLGLSVGVLQMGSRTEGGKKAFLVDLEKEATVEDQHQLVMVDRKLAYLADITYGTNSEFGFDYLRDNGRMRYEERVQRGHHYAVIDEVDNVLIDEARTPLIISGPSYDDAATYSRMAQVVKKLRPEDYEVNEKDRTITLTESGEAEVEKLLGVALRDPENPEEITNEQARLFGFLEQALRAEYLFKRDKDYIVQSRQVIIVDQGTGRMMPGRRWSDGLHQAVEAKEGVPVQNENITHATITIQNYFRMYDKLAGMTGTAMTEAEEFSKIYKLETVALPSNLEYRATGEDADLVELEATDEYNYRYTYYAKAEDPNQTRYLWKRKDYPDVVYRTEEAKLRAIVREVIQYHCIGRPILVGTTSVENSDKLSTRLNAVNVQKMLKTLLLRYTWLKQNNRVEDGRVVMALSFLNEPLDDLKNNEMKKLAADLGITLDFSDENIAFLLHEVLDLDDSHAEELQQVIHRGVPHEVLNAREHTKESKLIAKAGQLGAVTIATNMAGRGVDIKLGGEFDEEDMARIDLELKKHGVENYYDLSPAEKARAFEAIPESEYGIYADLIKAFIEYVNSMEKVIEVGGLHVIGSERHEARRIDNQLRGRAARQGDPGSSRFYLSMEDDLMRLFGGQQMDVMMQRLGMDEQLPLEVGMVGRIIEGAQTRVEGANFDSRKHILEYDDVLNSQRQTIYKQRDRIFLKEDLSEDILELLENEINFRFSENTTHEDLPTLLYWLSYIIQPSFGAVNGIYPSYIDKILLDELQSEPRHSQVALVEAALDLADRAASAYQKKVVEQVEGDIYRFQDRIDPVYQERVEGMNAFFEQLNYADETETPTDQQILNTVKELTSLEIKFEAIRDGLQSDDDEEEEQEQAPPQNKRSKYARKKSRKGRSVSLRNSTLIMENLDEAQELLEDELYQAINLQLVERLIGAINRRLPEDLEMDAAELNALDWDELIEAVEERVNEMFDKRRERFSREKGGGMIERLDNLFRYDRFVEDTVHDLKGYFSTIAPAEISLDRQQLADGAWKSIGNQINIYIDRKSISAQPQAHLLEEVQKLIGSALADLDPSNWQLSPEGWGQVKAAIHGHLETYYRQWLATQLVAALRLVNQERKMVFTKASKTVQSSTSWFSFHQYAAETLDNEPIDEIRQEVLDHLIGAHKARIQYYGLKVWQRLSPDWLVSDLPENARNAFANKLPEGRFESYQDARINQVQLRDWRALIDALGGYELSEFYREIFLRTISSLWIEYITEMEALRVKIGLEAYAQRDPLVAYKTQASEMFQTLFVQMQRDVVTRMFKNRGIPKGQKEPRLALIDKVREIRRENLMEEQQADDDAEEDEPMSFETES